MRSEAVKVQSLLDRLNRRNLRERVLILLTLLLVLTLGWYQVVMAPALAARKQVESERQQIETDLAQLKAQLQVVRQRASTDPDLEVRQQIAQLQDAINIFDRKLADRLVDLLSPQEMPALLQSIVQEQKGLRLTSMENLPAIPVLPKVADAVTPPGLYRHALVMEMDGSYLRLLEYLQALEKMPKRLFWDVLTIETSQFPEMHIRLQIHTLSLTEDWIGV